MPRALLVALLLATVAGCTPRVAVAPPDGASAGLAAIDSTDLRRFTAELSSDAYEGRGTGTPGEQKTVDFVVARFRALGLEGGMPDGSFVQRVPLRRVQVTDASPLRFRDGDAVPVSLDLGPDFIAVTDTEQERVSFDGARVVFVGYGITNPGYDWDDYKDVDVRGAVVVSFVNDPPATAAEPALFQADTLTYNGRWTYKYEEARRRGARAMLLIHTEPTASYPFTVLNGDARGPHTTGVGLPADGALDVRGWMNESAAQQLARASGSTLDEWFASAARRDFQPVELPVVADLSLTFRHASGVVGQNVVARLPGRTHPDEAIVYGAHHDHLGMDPDKIARGEDGIYNGAVDNATGVAMMLELAQAFTALPERPARSVYFITFSAEESGLLGSEHFARNAPLPFARVIANVNVDSGNLFGATDDIVGIGAERSELAGLFRAAAAAEGMTVTPDPSPNSGSFFRSDQLAFARGGVPAVFVGTGERFRGRPADYAARVRGAYRTERYHQVSDELLPGMRFDGLVQQTRVAFRLGYALATSAQRPAWKPGEAFGETRRASERAAGR